ncbi:MAG TPA: hypothetical protein VF623_05710 [Segetibacter sp.]|jgi:hypothetical protein
MRFFIIIACLITATAANAQSFLPGSFIDYNYRGSLLNNKNLNDSTTKKWFVSKYSSISTSFSFFKGGSATVVSAPMGLQLNRRLNNNLFAFAGASIAPAYISFNGSNFNTDYGKINNGSNSFNSKTLGIYSRAELGLQYVNDERTFSISGSIGIERNNYSYPVQRFNPVTNQTFPLNR